MNQISVYGLKKILCERIEEVLDTFGIEYHHGHGRIGGCCPIHQGDNESAFTITTDGGQYHGLWKCFTNGCDEHYRNDIVGLVHGLLEREKGSEVPFSDVVDYCEGFVTPEEAKKFGGENLESKDRLLFEFAEEEPVESGIICTRECFINSTEIPSSYYLKRGFQKQTLIDFDVGLCQDKNKPFYMRSVFPVYDVNHKNVIGATARSVYENNKIKWMNSNNFQSANNLYNYWRLEGNTAVAVEGAGDVMRLYESGITNAVGTFGAKMSKRQAYMLIERGVENLALGYDKDDAGQKARTGIKSNFGKLFNIHTLKFDNFHDIGSMSIEDVDKYIKPQIEEITND